MSAMLKVPEPLIDKPLLLKGDSTSLPNSLSGKLSQKLILSEKGSATEEQLPSIW